jgi:uncharacterized protein YjbJ (UPF0337 family)
MATIKGVADKVAGKTKQVVAEVTGDGKLREEGKAQERSGEASDKDEPGSLNPLGNLNQLT